MRLRDNVVTGPNLGVLHVKLALWPSGHSLSNPRKKTSIPLKNKFFFFEGVRGSSGRGGEGRQREGAKAQMQSVLSFEYLRWDRDVAAVSI